MNILPTSAALLFSSALCISSAQQVAPNTVTPQLTLASSGSSGSPNLGTGPPASCYALDTGASTTAVGAGGGDLLVMNYFTAPTGMDTITEISAPFGTPAATSYASGPITWAIWNDPTNDSDPSDAVLLYSATDVAMNASIATDVFQIHTVPNIAVTDGFFVGLLFRGYGTVVTEFPASFDQTLSSLGRSWAAADGVAIDLNNLGAAGLPPNDIAILGLDGVWLLHAVGPNCHPSTGTQFCFGDGTGGACPCGANGNSGEGCANTSGAGGATLTDYGSASLTTDTFTLDVFGTPGADMGLILRGANQLGGGMGVMAGDGLLCVAGMSHRSQVQTTVGGVTTFSDFNGSTFGDTSFGSGVSTNYQFWYRDIANPCTGSGFNFSNAVEVVWAP